MNRQLVERMAKRIAQEVELKTEHGVRVDVTTLNAIRLADIIAEFVARALTNKDTDGLDG